MELEKTSLSPIVDLAHMLVTRERTDVEHRGFTIPPSNRDREDITSHRRERLFRREDEKAQDRKTIGPRSSL